MDQLLPAFDRAIGKVFARLTATYGRKFMDQWEGLDEDVVMASWAHELSGYDSRLKPNPELVDNLVLLQPLAWALENLPERPLNAIEFRNLCRLAPAVAVPALPEPVADRARRDAELAKLAHVRRTQVSIGKGWAQALIDRAARGEFVNVGPLRMAKQALGMMA